MKILIIGGEGVIGSHFNKFYHDDKQNVHYSYFSHNLLTYQDGYQLNIIEKDSTENLILKSNPDIVIHAAALTNVDLCERDNDLANSINFEGTKNVISGCKKAQCKLIFISTSFVFDGNNKKYHENDIPNPINYYGITKLKAEEAIKNSDLSFLILRTDQPYCWSEKWQHTNSVIRAISTLRSRKILNEIIDWYNNPTYVPDLVNATSVLINKDISGLFHLAGSDYINRYEWSIKVAEIFDLDKDLIKPIHSDSLNLPVKRPNVNLSNKKLFNKIGREMMNVKDGLTSMLALK